jgi:hypothetical protein
MMATTSKPKALPEPWPPPKLRLPATIAAIERGKIGQRQLFPERRDDSRAGRLARLLALI